jgi:hypothetical protein
MFFLFCQQENNRRINHIQVLSFFDSCILTILLNMCEREDGKATKNRKVAEIVAEWTRFERRKATKINMNGRNCCQTS